MEDFPKGIFFKMPNSAAPEFVKGSLSIKVEDAIDFLVDAKKNGGKDWVNIDLLIAKSGKPYCKINTFTPKKQTEVAQDNADKDLPF